MRLLFLLIVLSSILPISAQQIQVVNSENDPLPGVVYYNLDQTRSGVTNLDGFADLSFFEPDESIIFRHLSQVTVSKTKQQIINQGGKLVMELDQSVLDEVVVSVSKFGQKRKDIPQEIVVLNSRDVRFNNPQTSADLLESSGQVYVQRSQLGGGSPLIRGFSTNRLLITVDGIRFNTAIFRGGNVQNIISIDPYSIDRTEVILGPGSVVHGSDAIGGVMNFFTKKPKFSMNEKLSLSGRLSSRYSSANNERTGHLELNLGNQQWAFLTSVTYSDLDDLRMGKYGPDDYLRREYVLRIDGADVVITNPDPRVQQPTGYNQINLMQKVEFMPSANWDFDLGLFYTTTSDYSRYDRLIRRRDDQLRSAEWYYGPQQWASANLQATHSAFSGIYDRSKLTLSYQQFKESRNDRDLGEIILFETDERVDAFSGGLDLSKNFGNASLFYGLEYVYNIVDSQGQQTDIISGSSQPDLSRYPDGATWQSLGAYGSLQWKLAPDLSFQGGLRYSHVLLDASFEGPFYDFPFNRASIDTGALTGSAGFTWQASDILGWRLNFGTAFRAPNIDDVGKVFDSEPGSVVVPNPDLKPEYAYNYELGANLNFDGLVRLEVAGYFTRLNDALVRRDFSLDGQNEIDYQGEPSNVQAIQNAATSELYGFEAGIEVNFTEYLQLSGHYNITDGFEETDDRIRSPVRHAAPEFGDIRLSWDKGKLRLDAFAEYNGQFDFEDLPISQQNNAFLYALDENGNPYAPSWYTLNFGGEYALSESLSLNAMLENITNQRYRSYSSGIAAPGINLIMAATYGF